MTVRINNSEVVLQLRFFISSTNGLNQKLSLWQEVHIVLLPSPNFTLSKEVDVVGAVSQLRVLLDGQHVVAVVS